MKASVVMIMVMGVLLILTTLAFTSIYLMSQHGQLSEQKILRIKAYNYVYAGLVHALARLRLGDAPAAINGPFDVDGDGNDDVTISIGSQIGTPGPLQGTYPVTISATY